MYSIVRTVLFLLLSTVTTPPPAPRQINKLIRVRAALRAPAPVHHHPWQAAEDDVQFFVEVQHRDGAELPRGAAGRRAVRRRHLQEVRVRVLLQRHERTVAGTVVRLVALRRYDEVPAELLEVDGQRVPAAERLVHRVVAVEAHVATGPSSALHRRHLHERRLEPKQGLAESCTTLKRSRVEAVLERVTRTSGAKTETGQMCKLSGEGSQERQRLRGLLQIAIGRHIYW